MLPDRSKIKAWYDGKKDRRKVGFYMDRTYKSQEIKRLIREDIPIYGCLNRSIIFSK